MKAGRNRRESTFHSEQTIIREKLFLLLRGDADPTQCSQLAQDGAGKGEVGREPSNTSSGNINWYREEESLESSSAVLHIYPEYFYPSS